ncbi:hypothetical protein, partial [Aeromonas caviae]
WWRNGFAHDVMVPSWRDQARGNSGSRDDRLTFSCQCHLGEQLRNSNQAAGTKHEYSRNSVKRTGGKQLNVSENTFIVCEKSEDGLKTAPTEQR